MNSRMSTCGLVHAETQVQVSSGYEVMFSHAVVVGWERVTTGDSVESRCFAGCGWRWFNAESADSTVMINHLSISRLHLECEFSLYAN
jgi:hypothetical protein